MLNNLKKWVQTAVDDILDEEIRSGESSFSSMYHKTSAANNLIEKTSSTEETSIARAISSSPVVASSNARSSTSSIEKTSYLSRESTSSLSPSMNSLGMRTLPPQPQPQPPELDLSHLSLEEKEVILNVMDRAKFDEDDFHLGQKNYLDAGLMSKNTRSSSMVNEAMRTRSSFDMEPNSAVCDKTNHLLSVGLDSHSLYSQRKSSLQILPNNNVSQNNHHHQPSQTTSSLSKLIKSPTEYSDINNTDNNNYYNHDGIEYSNDNANIVEIVLDGGGNNDININKEKQYLDNKDVELNKITMNSTDNNKTNNPDTTQFISYYSPNKTSKQQQLIDSSDSSSVNNISNNNKSKPKRKLPSTPSGLNQDPAAETSPYASHFSLLVPSIVNSNNPQIITKTIPGISRPKLVENVTEWLNKSFDQTKLSSSSLTEKNVNEPNSPYNLNVSGQKQFRSHSVAVPVPIISDNEPLIEINMNKHFSHLANTNKTSSCETGLSPNVVETGSRSINDLVETRNQKEKRILIYTDPKDVVSSPTDNKQVVAAAAGSSSTSNSRRSSLSLGMEIIGARSNGAPAIVSSIPPDGIIKQFGVDIGEGDEIVSINGHSLRNQSDNDIDRIIQESAIVNQGELELLVLKKSSSTSSSLQTTQPSQVIEYGDRRSTTEEMLSSHDSQMHDAEMAASPLQSSSIGQNQQQHSGVKSRQISSSSSSLASNSSSSTSCVPRQLRSSNNINQHTPDQTLNYIDENGVNFDHGSVHGHNFSRSSVYNSSVQSRKSHSNVGYGEGRGFNEISIKRHQLSPKRDFIMSDPAQIAARQRQQRQAPSPKTVQPQSPQSPQFPQTALSTTALSPRSSMKSYSGRPDHATAAEKHVTLSERLSEPKMASITMSTTPPATPKSATTIAPPSFPRLTKQPSESGVSTMRVPHHRPTIAGPQKSYEENRSKDIDSLFASYSSTPSKNDVTPTTPKETDLDLSPSPKIETAVSFNLAPISQPLVFQPLVPPLSPNLISQTTTSTTSQLSSENANKSKPFGELQVQIKHNDDEQQITVKILKARNLIARDANGFSDPYVKCYLLPGRDQENKRRTKHVLKSLNPEWNCTVVYPNVHKEELKYKTLEFTVWDWDRFKSNDFLGMVKIDLKDDRFLDDKPHWFILENNAFVKDMEESSEHNISTQQKRSFRKKKETKQ